MGKKKTKSNTAHPQESFQQLVARTALNIVKPYATELMMELANDLSLRVFKQIGNVQTRIMAIEELLIEKMGITLADIELKASDIEDEATGYKTADRPAQEGDLIRVVVSMKTKEGTEFSAPQKRLITKLLNKPHALTQTVEEGIVGMTSGQTKEMELDGGAAIAKITVSKVSEKIVKEQPAPVQEGSPS
jgi:FKBP-type peptidyl-prolyl cis-trans isomerase (trigger factor)